MFCFAYAEKWPQLSNRELASMICAILFIAPSCFMNGQSGRVHSDYRPLRDLIPD
jgi:hypothetical protein